MNKASEAVLAVRVEPVDPGELGESAIVAAPLEHRDQADRFRDQRSRDGQHRFLDELFEAPKGAQRAAGVDRADAARMGGALGFQQVEGFGPAHLTDGDTVGLQAERRAN